MKTFNSFFKDPEEDKKWFIQWVNDLETLNQKKYHRIEIETRLGKTCVWGLNTTDNSLQPLIIFPGARTTVLFWDLNNGLEHLKNKYRIYMVETNGLPNLSDGTTPEIKSQEYGKWASDVMEKLKIDSAYIAGASFGGLICMKLAMVAPQKVKAAFLLNAGCLQPFSMSFKNLYYNILPIVSPTTRNISKFLYKAVFYKPEHQLTGSYEKLVITYEQFALTRYKDRTQKPYYMKEELQKVNVPTYIIEGNKDLLFPYKKSIKNAQEKISSLKEVVVFENVGHGIETYHKAIVKLGDLMNMYSEN